MDSIGLELPVAHGHGASDRPRGLGGRHEGDVCMYVYSLMSILTFDKYQPIVVNMFIDTMRFL